ncbi:MAG: CooT family nickel-binding protein [Spirochaetota bacterium]
MCLSAVYTGRKEESALVMEEAARVTADQKGVRISTLFGESTELEGYDIREVDLLKNYVVLGKRG